MRTCSDGSGASPRQKQSASRLTGPPCWRCPLESFEARRVEQRGANSLSLVRFDRNDYSVPTAFAHHDVTALGGIGQVRLLVGTEVVATHPRCWSKEQVSFDPRHYLALLERKPGALD